jgi:exonuclease III
MGVYKVTVNEDGPGAKYTPNISQYLANMNYDFISVQENFSYDSQLYSSLSANYDRDPWSGGLNTDKMTSDVRFMSDGLNAFWKKGITAVLADSVSWKASYGKFDHAWDAIVTKGFRRYDVKLNEGSELVIYNMHMDAGDDQDEAKGLDGPDCRARMVQWRQLRDYILSHLDTRPVIIMGDLNSWYERDSIKIQFIDEIERTGRATVSDTWIELVKSGIYPGIYNGIVTKDRGTIDWSRNGELLDKILYINPKGGSKLYPINIFIDHEGYQKDDGTPLGDHSPLAVTFKIRNQAR